MIRLLITCLVILWGGTAAAQVLQVRSGEHAGFTRLVIDIPPGTDWALSPGQPPYDREIEFPGRSFSFDTGDVFQRLNANRLLEVGTPTATSNLGLKLACDCKVDAFVLDSKMLVVDISDAEPDNSLAPLARSTPKARPRMFADLQDGPPPVGAVAPAVETFGTLPLDKLASRHGSGPNSAPTEIDRQTGAQQIALAEIERTATQQLARAVTRGLLDISADPPGPAAVPDDPPHPPGHDPVVSHPTVDEPNLSLEAGRILLSGVHCMAAEDLALADWAGEGPFVVQLGELRQDLVGEFDLIDPQKAMRLAKFYLHFGLGNEAQTLLRLSDPGGSETLDGLGNLLIGLPKPVPVFEGQTHCDGPAALWSVLNLTGTQPGPTINTNAVLRAFEDLPEPLKPYLAHRLVDRLLAQGERPAAQDLLKRIARLQPAPNAEVALARARMDMQEGLLESASQRLTEVARTETGYPSAQAVEALVSINTVRGKPTPTDISELASAYSVEYRGSDDRPGLWRAHIRALIGRGAFTQAFKELDSDSSGQPETDRSVRVEAANALIEHAEDNTFLRIALASDSEHPLGNDRDTVLAATERMLLLGLPDAAAKVLKNLREDQEDRPARLLDARVLLAQDRPEDAEISLIGLQGLDVLELRAEARARMGDYSFAQMAFDEVGRKADSAYSAWIAGDWDTVAQTADGPFSDAARLSQSDALPVSADARLEGSEALVSDSQETRETLNELLQATRLLPDG
ncbi:hypothetical protein [Puniceibacterium confluentis]|uniref:hypothetical protein n=1 Tax=Puniceibacterium confluentis TaxID=1958944 RepID=UPI0035660284